MQRMTISSNFRSTKAFIFLFYYVSSVRKDFFAPCYSAPVSFLPFVRPPLRNTPKNNSMCKRIFTQSPFCSTKRRSVRSRIFANRFRTRNGKEKVNETEISRQIGAICSRDKLAKYV